MVLLFVSYFFIFRWCDVLGLYQEACGLWWETRYIPITGALLNLLVNIVLVQTIGLPGILISTNLSILFVYDMGCSAVLFRTYFKSVEGGFGRFWRRQMIYVPEAVICGGITWGICNLVVFNSDIAQLLFNAFVCVIIPNAVFFAVWRKRPEMIFAKKKAAGLYRTIMRKLKQ